MSHVCTRTQFVDEPLCCATGFLAVCKRIGEIIKNNLPVAERWRIKARPADVPAPSDSVHPNYDKSTLDSRKLCAAQLWTSIVNCHSPFKW